MQSLSPNVPQFLFDDAWIADHRRLTRHWLPATVYPKPILEPTPPHERCLCYCSVLLDPGGGYRMYYWKFDPPAPRRPTRSTISLATSRDGFHWVKQLYGGGMTQKMVSSGSNVTASRLVLAKVDVVVFAPRTR